MKYLTTEALIDKLFNEANDREIVDREVAELMMAAALRLRAMTRGTEPVEILLVKNEKAPS